MTISSFRYRYALVLTGLGVACFSASHVAAGPSAQPQPVGSSTMSITYDTTSGPLQFSGSRSHDGTGLSNITNLGGAPNVGAFSAHNTLGRRPASAQGTNETLMRHGFYKYDTNGFNIPGEFFPDFAPGGNVTIEIQNIEFDRPVQVQANTALLHVLWNIDQVDGLGLNNQGLPRAYSSPHNHRTAPEFRDIDDFQNENVFLDNPVPNYSIGDITPTFSQPQPNVLTVSLTFPYELFRHLQDDGLGVPAGLPGPQGFLEPFHFHLEYLVVPEPTTGVLLAIGVFAICKRRK